MSREMSSGQLILSGEAHHASQHRQPGSERERQMTVGSGQKLLESLRQLGHDGSCLKTLLEYLVYRAGFHSTMCYLRWKVSAITTTRTDKTKSHRLLFRLQVSTRRTDGTEFGLLLTPTGTNLEPGEDRTEKRMAFRNSIGRTTYCPAGLSEQIAMLPTPKGIDGIVRHSQKWAEKKYNEGGDVDLTIALKMLPTPKTRDWKGESQRGPAAPMDGVQNSLSAASGITKQDRHGTNRGLKLHSDFASWMMGFPIDWMDT